MFMTYLNNFRQIFGKIIGYYCVCVLFVFNTVLFSGCSSNSNLNNGVCGGWSIDTLYFIDDDITACMVINGITFEENRVVLLPVTEYFCEGFEEYVDKGEWDIIDNDSISNQLIITTKNHFFNGIHRIEFYPDYQNKLLKMRISSDSLYVVCRKFFVNFDKSINFIRALEEKTKKKR